MYIDKLGFDPDTVPTLSFGELLKRIGPGIILTGVVIGPGAITTASMLGANYGYQMLWLFIPIFIMGITFMLSCYRICMLTGMPIIHAIRHYYGKGAAAFVGICLFFSCLFSDIPGTLISDISTSGINSGSCNPLLIAS